MTWGFIWMIVVLKIPIVALLWLVWWAVHSEPDASGDESEGGDGGLRTRAVHPRRPFPRRPRRGPHGDPPCAPPPRTRTVVARGRRAGRHS